MIQPETQKEMNKVPPGTVAHRAMEIGYDRREPLLFAMDGMLRYAKAYRKAYDSAVGDDSVLGPDFMNVVKGLRGLLNGQGCVAMEHDLTTDSKDNGVIEALYWTICEVAGVDGDA